MKFQRSSINLAITSIVLTGSPALSTSTSAADDDDGTNDSIPTIEIRAVVPDNFASTPGTVGRLTADEIEELRPYTLHDAFDFIPGVRTIDDDVLGRRGGIGIRGAQTRRSRKTLLLEDGVPINAATYLDPSAHYTPPMERLERVDVLKGSGQILHGPLNNYGVINFRNKQATLNPETTVDFAGGNLNTFKRHVMHTRTEGNVGLVFSYQGANADGAFDTEETQYDDVYTSLAWDINDQHELGLSLTYLRERSDGYDENNLSPEEYAANPRGKLIFDEGREFNNISVNYVKLDLSHEFQATDRLRFSSKIFATELDRPRFRTRGESPDEGGVMEGRDREYRTFGVQSRAELANIEFAGIEHNVQAGIRWETQDFDDKRPVGLPGERLNEGNRGNAFAVAGQDGYTRDGRFTEFEASAASFFVQDAIRIDDWTVTPGLRVETYTQKKRETFRPGRELANESSDETLLLPGISFLYGGIADTQVYGGVHRGYAPAIARSIDFPLQAETGINTELGLRTSALRGLEVDVAAFYNVIEDTLIKEDFTDDFGDNIFINTADSESYGVDLGVQYNSSAYTNSALNVFSRLAYNFTSAEFTQGPLDGNRVPEIPRHAGSLTLGIEHLTGWKASVTASYFGDFFADRENTRVIDENTGLVPSRTLISARASYTLQSSPKVSFYVQGRNLTDRLYITDVSDGLRPGAERTLIAGVRVALK